MAESKKPEKKQTSVLVYVGIGCVVLLFLIGIGTTVFFKFFAKKAIQGVIENKTGVKVDVGTASVPDNFPKDFPLYPGAKITSSLSGSKSGDQNGIWLTLTTGDGLDKVSSYYKTELVKNGWGEEASYTAGDTTTLTVTKGTWSGSLAITNADGETQIVIIVGEDNTAQ